MGDGDNRGDGTARLMDLEPFCSAVKAASPLAAFIAEPAMASLPSDEIRAAGAAVTVCSVRHVARNVAGMATPRFLRLPRMSSTPRRAREATVDMGEPCASAMAP